MKNKIILPLLFVLFAAVACFAGYKVLDILQDYDEGENAYDSLRQNVSVSAEGSEDALSKKPAPDDEGASAQEEAQPEETPDPHAGIDFPEVDFGMLSLMNEDIIGWIHMENSPIDYPIVQGEDNDEYIRKLPDGKYNIAGSIFMDYRNAADFGDRHTIIYGHRMNNNSMFGTIVNYSNQTWYDEHPRCFIMTAEENYVVEFFSGYVVSVDEEAWKLDFESDDEFEQWVAEAMARSNFESDVIPEAGERIITLSTCNRINGYTRFVLLGVLR